MPVAVKLTIKRSVRVVKDAEIMAAKRDAMQRAADAIQAKARALASVPQGLGTGIKTGKLVRSIKVAPITVSESGKSLQTRIYADTEDTMTDAGAYASFQESGTGLHSALGTRDWIRPKQRKIMHWVQEGRAYRGSFVNAIARQKRGSGIPGKPITSYDQWAFKVRGVKPKWFIRDAGREKSIKDAYAAEISEIGRRSIIARS